MSGEARGRRLAGILALAALIAIAATLFGNEFAPEATHHEQAEAAAEDAETEEADEAEHLKEEEEEEEETGAGQIAGAILISIGGVALAPLTAPLARRPKVAEEMAGRPEAVAGKLRVGLALLSIGAAIIHFAVIAQHLDEWWLTGTFFIVVALFQLAWAVAVLALPSPLLFLTGAAVNALVVITWIVSRTVGVPVGPEAGEAESIGLPDVLATSYEALLVAAIVALALRAGATRLLRPFAQAAGTWILTVAVVALTALTLALLP
jgi:hypothetical protein